MSSRISDDSAGQERSKGETQALSLVVVTLIPTNTAGSNTKELSIDLPCPGPNIILQMPGPGLVPRRHASDAKC